MSQFSCPDFSNADVSAVGGINFGNCDPDEWEDYDDEASLLVYPLTRPP